MPLSPARAARSQPGIGQAPGDLATLQAFVNTLDVEQNTDEFSTPAGLDRWLHGAGLLGDPGGLGGHGSPARPRDLATAVELREAFRAMLRWHVTHQVPEPSGAESAARVTEIAGGLEAQFQADVYGRVVVVPAGSGTQAALTRLLLIAAEATTLGTWTRLKVCSADDCQWAFYDRSPTRSGCWCSMQICGSRAKSRAYRSRAARTS